jgi:hypothetical protein
MPAVGSAKADDLWLALDTVRADVGALQVAVRDRKDAVAVTDAMTIAADRLADLLEDIPARIRAAVEEGVARLQARTVTEVSPSDPAQLAPALADVRRWGAELQAELVRLAAFRKALADDMPSLAGAVDVAVDRASERLRAAGLPTGLPGAAGTADAPPVPAWAAPPPPPPAPASPKTPNPETQ